MFFVLAIIGALYIMFRVLDEAQCDREYPGNHDWEESMKDSIKVNKGELSLKEYKKRMKTGYYNKLN